MSAIAEKLREIGATLRSTEARFKRPAGAVSLLAVSKRHSAASIRDACAAGQRAFGENYLQEALEKQRELADLDIEWHFIGAIQSNKTADIAQHFDWVHTVSRPKIADRLNAQRPAAMAPLNVLIQVNISGEDSKSGVAPGALDALVTHIDGLPRLALRGLMALPAPVSGFEQQRVALRAVARLAARAPAALETLSMGTSDDFEAAIAEGATIVRLGTAIFGPRPAAD